MRASAFLGVVSIFVTVGVAGAQVPTPAGAARPLGPYTALRATAADCSGMTGPGQPVGSYDYAYTSDVEVGYRALESMLDASLDVVSVGPVAITSMRWWGISWEWSVGLNDWLGYCGADDAALTPFRLVFYATSGTRAPACPVAVRTVVPSIQDSGLPWGEDFNVMEYQATFEPVDGSQVSWVAVERLEGADAASGNPCYFLRINEADVGTYDDTSYQIGDVGFLFDDLPFCLNTTAAASSYPDIFMSDLERGFLDCWSNVVGAVE